MTPIADEFAEIARRLAEIRAEKEQKSVAPQPERAPEGMADWASFPPASAYDDIPTCFGMYGFYGLAACLTDRSGRG